MSALWILDRVSLTTDAKLVGRNAQYRYHVGGINRETGDRFSWSVPSIDARYDSSAVKIPAIPRGSVYEMGSK